MIELNGAPPDRDRIVQEPDINFHRVVLGFILTPLLLGFLSFAISGQPFILYIFIIVGYPGILVLAIPVYFIVKRFWIVNIISCLVCGVSLGSFTGVIFIFILNPNFYVKHIEDIGLDILFGSVFGLVFGLTFWLIAVARWSRLVGDAR